jgi:hypothetical protein
LWVARADSIENAVAFVDDVGLAVVWGKADLVLPSLWDAIGGGDDWAVRDSAGKAVEFTPEFRRLWAWKDELPERKLSCAGRHLGGRAAVLIAPRLLGAAYSLTGRSGEAEDFRVGELEGVEVEVAEAVLENGPLTGPEIRTVLGTDDRKTIERAVTRLQRRLVLTNAGAVEQSQGWRAIRHDLLARRWRKALRRLPDEADARGELVQAVLKGAGEVSAPDVAGALGWRRKQAEAALEDLVDRGSARTTETDGIPLYR